MDTATAPTVILLSIGNTRTQVGVLERGEVGEVSAFPNDSAPERRAALGKLVGDRPGVPAVLAWVNGPGADVIERDLRDLGVEVHRLMRDVRMELVHSLDDDSTVGQDRLLNAVGAFARARQACIVIDAGTAITVDFVDGEGVFHGGAIAPGLRMMLSALHEKTAALPEVELTAPDPARGPFGKDMRHAMLLGVTAAATGLAHLLIDRYAEFYKAYPRVIATGGDATLLFSGDELVETIVPELTLLGLAEVCRRALGEEVPGGEEP